jgi:outer membrane protein assembly factor BamB
MHRMKHSPRLLPPSLALGLFAAAASAGDWPQWRGPHRDGVAPDQPTLTALPAELKPLWKLEVGPGHAAPVVVGDKLLYLDQVGEAEVAHAVDRKTGKELWRQAYDPAAVEYSGFGKGPRCAPLVEGDRVYLQSGRGEFQCLSLADGRKRWGFSFEQDFGATWFGNRSGSAEAKETAARRHGNNGAPVIDGDRIFVAVGDPQGATLVCFDKLTGKKHWQVGTDNAAYASLMVGTLAGVRQVIHYTADALMGVEAASGRLLWRVPIKTGAKRHTVTPILHGDSVLVSSHSVGMMRFDLRKSGDGVQAAQAWVNKDVATMLCTPVLRDGHLYALGSTVKDKSDFVCVEFATGKLRWSQPGFDDYASVIASGDKLLVLNSSGQLLLLRANPKNYEELGRLQACGKTWSFPAYSDGVLYLRDGRQLMAVELAK